MTPSDPLYPLMQAGLRSPGMLTLAITGTCNLACCHCWVKAGESSSLGSVPLQTVHRLVTEFAATGGSGIRITGGEPLCHPDWLEIVQLARTLGFNNVILQTNAMLLNAGHLATLRALDFPGLLIQISLDGVSSRTHDLVRGEGAFKGALLGIEMLVREGFAGKVSLFFTEMRHNLEEIPALLDFADSMGIAAVSSGSLVLCGRAAATTCVAPPAVEQYQRLLERYDRDERLRELYARLGTVAAFEWQAGAAVREECCTFIENPYLTPSGRLYPCLLCHNDAFSVSGVFEKGLAAAFAEGAPLWSSLLAISRCRSEAILECRDCSGSQWCAGGCMGRAWGSYGNLLAADDRCAVRRAIFQHQKKPQH